MRQPARVAPTPIFDRLVSPDSFGQSEPTAALDFAGLRASLRRELERLLVSRVRRPHESMPGFRSTVDYGVGDHFMLDPHSEVDRKALAQDLEDVIAAFEPRLSDPRVRVYEPSGVDTSIRVRIDGAIAVGAVKEPLTFVIARRGDFIEVSK